MSNTKKASDPVFNLDDFLAENQKPPYEFFAFDRTWTMTHIGELDAWNMLKSAEAGDEKAAWSIVELAFGTDQFAKFREHPLPQHGLEELFRRYREFCGVGDDDEGGSQASTSS